MILDATQFRQLVTEVAMALAADSTGVGEVEVVDSLAGINSLPALKIEFGRETVVEAPLSLLSKKADDAADEVYEAIIAANVATVAAAAAADRADAGRIDLEEVKQQAGVATSESLTQTVVSKDETRLMGEMRLVTLATLTDLQKKLVDVVIVIANAHFGAEELAEFQKRANETFVVIARNAEEVLLITEEQKSLRAQVADIIWRAFAAIDVCNLSADDAHLFGSLAVEAAEVAEQASIRAIGSASGADAAASYATEQAEKARLAAEEAAKEVALVEKSISGNEAIRIKSEESRMAAELEREKQAATIAPSVKSANEAAAYAKEQGDKLPKFIVLTQVEYDKLPADKLSDGNYYIIL